MKKLRVLIVDDGPVNLVLVQNLMTRKGYESETAENGKAALEYIKSQEFDLVLMDLEMPVMDGITTCKKIRNDLGLTMPIIAISGGRENGRGDITDSARVLGADMMLIKPFRARELDEALQRAMGARRTSHRAR